MSREKNLNTELIGKLCTQIRGVSYKKGDAISENIAGFIPLFRANNIQDGVLVSDDLLFVPEKLVSDKQLLKKGDIVIAASSGSINIVGKAAFVKEEKEASFGAFCKLIRPNDKVIPEYLNYYFQSEQYRRLISQLAQGANINNLRNEHIDNLQIPLPPLTEQKHIAKVLDTADALIKKNKALLQEYNDLQQAIFLDMFGDPVTNPKGWEIRTIENFVREEKGSIKRGPFGGALKKEIFVEDGYLVYEQYHALNNDFSFGRYFINESKFQEMKGFEVKPKDIIISCSGVYLGKLAIVPKGSKKGIINQALLKITLDNLKMNNIFFTYHFSHKNFKESFFGSNRGAGIPNFPPMKDFKKFPFIYPPIDLQNKFASIIENIEQQKEKAKESLAYSEELFSALVGRYFGNGKDN